MNVVGNIVGMQAQEIAKVAEKYATRSISEIEVKKLVLSRSPSFSLSFGMLLVTLVVLGKRCVRRVQCSGNFAKTKG